MKTKRSSASKIAVNLQNVTKRYVLRHEKPTFAETLTRGKKEETFTSLNNITLTIHKGEKVGIIGSNGSGKTTLLKIISGITTPNRGSVTTNGKVVSLIDLEAGFHPDLTGEENIFLNGLIVGMSKQEIKNKLDHIVAFADIGNFIDTPLFTYSEGMKLRLGFAIAVHAEPDILILDEGIAVGDANFRLKAEEKIQQFFKAGKTIIVVTHWMEFLQANCHRIIWLKNGLIHRDGDIGTISEFLAYSK